MAVVTADKLDDLVPAGYAPGQSQGAHCRFRAGIDHPDHFHTGHRGDNFLASSISAGQGAP